MQLQRRPDACWGRLAALAHPLSSSGNDRPSGDASEVVLWSPTERRLHILNSTAAAVWSELKTPTTIDDLVDSIAETFRARRPIVARDVGVLVDRLHGSELLCDSELADGIPPVRPIEELGRLGEHVNAVGQHTVGPLRVLGRALIVDSNDQQLFQALSSILAPLRDQTIDLANSSAIQLSATRSDDGWDIERNGENVGHARSLDLALRSVLAEVNAAPLAVQQTNVVLHAAGASFDGDSVVVFPGVSNSGKSTLVAQLVDRGHSYLTDEAVAIDTRTLDALPFHKAICVEPMGQIVLDDLEYAASQPLISSTWDVDPRRVGVGRLAERGTVSALVFPTFSPSENTKLTPLEPLDALQKLIANAFDFATVGQPAFASLVQLANNTPAYTLVHGGDGSQLTVLEDMFGASTSRPRLAS